MFVLSLELDGEIVQQWHSYQTIGKTLKLAAKEVRGIPQAQMHIRKYGQPVAWIQTNFRGAIEEAEIWGKGSMVYPINPNWHGFADAEPASAPA